PFITSVATAIAIAPPLTLLGLVQAIREGQAYLSWCPLRYGLSVIVLLVNFGNRAPFPGVQQVANVRRNRSLTFQDVLCDGHVKGVGGKTTSLRCFAWSAIEERCLEFKALRQSHFGHSPRVKSISIAAKIFAFEDTFGNGAEKVRAGGEVPPTTDGVGKIHFKTIGVGRADVNGEHPRRTVIVNLNDPLNITHAVPVIRAGKDGSTRPVYKIPRLE